MAAGKREEFLLIGAGLPRTGTLSTRAALLELVGGQCYHMATVLSERPDHYPHWRKALKGQASVEDWRATLADYRCGVDYPISFFYKEIMLAFPNAKVLLNVRDPAKWYDSVKNAIYRLHKTAASWPCSWFLRLMGKYEAMEMVRLLSYPVPSCSSLGLGMFGSIEAGREATAKFWQEHVNEVKCHVPAERLLVWDVREGWEPLCKFLNVPVPNKPFPRVNDTEEIERHRSNLLLAAWVVVVVVPLLLLLTWLCLTPADLPSLLLLGLLGGAILWAMKATLEDSVLHLLVKKKKNQ